MRRNDGTHHLSVPPASMRRLGRSAETQMQSKAAADVRGALGVSGFDPVSLRQYAQALVTLSGFANARHPACQSLSHTARPSRGKLGLKISQHKLERGFFDVLR